MNTTMKLRRILAVIALILAGATSESLAQTTATTQPVGFLRFPFPAGTDLVGQTEATGGTWQSAGPAGPAIKIGQGSLSVPGLANSSGNHAVLAGVSGPGARITFRESFSSNTVFYSFALKVADLTGLGDKGGAFIGLAPAGGAQFPLAAAISINAAENGYRIGLAKRATGNANDFFDVFTELELQNDVVFVVASYTFSAGPGNDTARLWVNPPSMDGSSNDSSFIMSSGGEDFENLSDLSFIQQSPPALPALTLVDEIRVGKTWASVTPAAAALIGSFPFALPPDTELVGRVEPDGAKWDALGPAGAGIKIGSGSLSIAGRAASTGNHARLAGVVGPGTRIALPEALSSGSIYYSLILQVPELGNLGQTFVPIAGLSDQVGPAGSVPGLGARLVIRAAEGGYILGVGKTALDANFVVGTFTTGHWANSAPFRNHAVSTDVGLIVVRYTFNLGDNNDEVALWINPRSNDFGAATPPAPDLTTTEGADWQTFKALALVQQVSPPMPALTLVDEIRIGTTWASVTPKASALIGWSPGSNGSYGPLNVTEDSTLPLPPDGILHTTSINIAAGKTLRFSKNANNTPVYLLVTGRVQIDGTIDVSGGPGTTTSAGLAGPGGWDGGMPITGTVPAGDGFGPGGGRYTGGRGAPAAHQFPNDPNLPPGGATYGGPLGIEGGSGGSGVGYGGGGGGGSIIISAGEEIVVGAQGAVIAKGGNAGDGGANAGSGGRIRLIAPRVLGTGALLVPGGDSWRGPNMGGWGWVRVDRLDRSPLTLNVPVPGYFTSPLSIGAVMKVLPDPAPRLRIKSVDGVAVAADSGPVTLIRSQDAPSSVNVVVEAGNFGSLVPAQLYIVPDNAPRSVLKATIDNRPPSDNPVEHTFAATVPPNMRATLQVFAGKSLPANP
jgi:hypothetical protein